MPKKCIKGIINGSETFIEERIEGAGDTFLVSFLDGYLYYSPLANVSILFDAFGASTVRKYFRKEALLPDEQSLIDDLSEQNVFKLTQMQQDTSSDFNAGWTPTSATFSNTQKCTLRCKYCYAEGGRLDDLDIPWPLAKAAIDLIIKNAIEQQVDPSIRFLGEGEATASWRVFQNIIEYFKKQCRLNRFAPIVTLNTNGVFPQSRLDYIAKNCTNLIISLDGVRQVHNENRILPNGDGSFDRIVATLKDLDGRGVRYSIRSTVTESGTSTLTEFVRFVGKNLQCKSIHAEPVFDTTVVTNLEGEIRHVDAQTFVESFREARRVAAGLGIDLTYSGASLQHRQNFCGSANASNFMVTSSGIVTSCNEVLQPSDIRAKLFHYGIWDQKAGEFIIDQETIRRLRKLNVHEMPKCQGCIAKYNCAGDCYAKGAAWNGDPASMGYTLRCHITRELLKDNLIFRLISEKLDITDERDLDRNDCPF